MHRVDQSRVVPYTPAQMFALVTEVTEYPQFLPWIRSVRVLSREADVITAEFLIGYGPVKASFISRAEMRPKEEVRLRLVSGIFSSFQGAWRFDSGPDGGTRVAFHLEFEFASGSVARFLRPFLQREVNHLVDAFERRADQRYGSAADGERPPDHHP